MQSASGGPRETILFLPQADEDDAQVQARWREYVETGKTNGGIVIYPRDVSVTQGNGETVFITEPDEGGDWYKTAESQSVPAPQEERQAITAHPGDIVHTLRIVFDENFYGNTAHELQRHREICARAQTPADDTGREHPSETNGIQGGGIRTASDPGAAG